MFDMTRFGFVFENESSVTNPVEIATTKSPEILQIAPSSTTTNPPSEADPMAEKPKDHELPPNLQFVIESVLDYDNEVLDYKDFESQKLIQEPAAAPTEGSDLNDVDEGNSNKRKEVLNSGFSRKLRNNPFLRAVQEPLIRWVDLKKL